MENSQAKRAKLDTIEHEKNLTGRSKESKVIFELNSSDFSKIVTTSGFVDKTLLIKSLFESTCKVLITAPPRFGKSTNIDMIKRFLEIEVDGDGKPLDATTTRNYRLFHDNKLKITKHEQFCKLHLGKHPVLLIDYKPLSEISDFDCMLSKFRGILQKTYEDHIYLSGVQKLWSGNHKLDTFNSFLDPEKNKALNVYDLKCGFVFLAEVLHRHFGKPVFVLIDEYDAYINSFIFKGNPDMTRIINFIQSASADLLKSSNFIDHALVTSVFQVASQGLPLTFTKALNGITNYKFLQNHPFSLYYGMTTKELDKLLKKLIKDDKKKEKYKNTINKYYNGYTIEDKNIKLYSIWSVLQFFENNNKVRSHWCRNDFIFSIKDIIKVDKIKDQIQQLLVGNFVSLDISKTLSKSDILTLNEIRESSGAVTDSSVDIFLNFLYVLGYLSIVEMKREPIASLKIPNQEVYFQFAKLLKNTYEIKYNFEPKHIDEFQSALNSFCSREISKDKVKHFYSCLNSLFNTSKLKPQTKNDLLVIIFIFLACKFSTIKSESLKLNSDENIDIMTVNDHDIGIVIQMTFNGEDTSTTSESAVNIHKHIIERKYHENVKKIIKRKVKGIVRLGISFGFKNEIAIAYSFQVKEGNSFSNSEVIP